MCADSTASGKLNASLRKSFAVIFQIQNSCPIELELPQIKKKRQTERNSDEHCTQPRQPEESHSQPPSFTLNEREEHDCRDDYVQSEERADAIRKKIVHEHRHVQRVMLDDPRNELRIRQNEPKQTEHQVEMPRFHACDLSARLGVCRAKVPRSSVCKATAREANCATIRRWRHCVFTLFQTRRSTRSRANMAARLRSNCARRRWKQKLMPLCVVFLPTNRISLSQQLSWNTVRGRA